MSKAYSLLSEMSDKPYAIGERPGGNYIPTIPLLSGRDAWSSLNQYYHRDLLPYPESPGPRHRQDRLNKAANQLGIQTPAMAAKPTPPPTPPVPPTAAVTPPPAAPAPPLSGGGAPTVPRPSSTPAPPPPATSPPPTALPAMAEKAGPPPLGGPAPTPAPTGAPGLAPAPVPKPTSSQAPGQVPQATRPGEPAGPPSGQPTPAPGTPGSDLPAEGLKLFGVDPGLLRKAGPEAEAQVVGTIEQVMTHMNKSNPAEFQRMQEGIASGNPQHPANTFVANQIQQQLGVDKSTAWGVWENMDSTSKLLAGMGIAIGTISLISSLTGGENGMANFLGMVLGFGAATGAFANAGMFGAEAEKFTKGLMGMTGLGGADPIAAQQAQEAAATKGIRDAGLPDAPPPSAPGAPDATTAPASVPATPGAPPDQAFGQLMGDNKIDKGELDQILQDPALKQHILGLPDEQGLGALRAVVAGQPELGDKLQMLKKYPQYKGDVAKALGLPVGGSSGIGPMGMGGQVPGMGLNPTEAARFLGLSERL